VPESELQKLSFRRQVAGNALTDAIDKAREIRAELDTNKLKLSMYRARSSQDSSKIVIDSKRASAAKGIAFHSWQGEIVVNETTTRNAGATTFAPGDTATQYNTFVHEAIRGHSPIAPSVYRGDLGVVLEESTTEAASQFIMDSLRDRKFMAGDLFQLTEETYRIKGENVLMPGHKAEGVHYGDFIATMVRTVKAEAGITDDNEALRTFAMASVDMRKTTKVFDNENDYLDHFMRQVPAFRTRMAEAAAEAGADFDRKLARATSGDEPTFTGRFLANRGLGSEIDLKNPSAEVKKALDLDREYQVSTAERESVKDSRKAFADAAKKVR